jgi:CheY-like chemotaxis protein
MTATLLIAEDDIAIRTPMADFLRDAGYDVMEAGSADEAVAIFESGAPIALLFSDVRMPGSMDGCELARKVRSQWPDTHVLLTSGYSSAWSQAADETSSRFLPKPYRPLSLLGEIISLIEP